MKIIMGMTNEAIAEIRAAEAQERAEKLIMEAPKYFLDQDRILCTHEAGHTVAARHHGFRVAWVSVDTNFIRNDPLGVENNCNISAGTSMVIASERINPLLQRGRISGKEDEALLAAYAVGALCGPTAEIYLLGTDD